MLDRSSGYRFHLDGIEDACTGADPGFREWLTSLNRAEPMTPAAQAERSRSCPNGQSLWADTPSLHKRRSLAWKRCDLARFGLLTEADVERALGPAGGCCWVRRCSHTSSPPVSPTWAAKLDVSSQECQTILKMPG